MNLSKSFKYIKVSNHPEKVGKKSEIKAVYYLVISFKYLYQDVNPQEKEAKTEFLQILCPTCLLMQHDKKQSFNKKWSCNKIYGRHACVA